MAAYCNLEDMAGANPDEQFEAAFETKKAIMLSEGTTRITRPIRPPVSTGGIIAGHGKSEHHNPGNQLAGSLSQLFWASDNAMQMLDYQSSEFLLTDLEMNGDGKASHGILMQKTTSGIGTGKMHVEDVLIRDCGVAIQTGLSGQHNCDVSYFENVTSKNCPVFFRSLNDMSIDHTFFRCMADADVFIDLVKGGTYYIKDCTTTSTNPTTLLQVTGAYGPNNNNNRAYVDGFKADNNKGSAFKLFEVLPDTIFRGYFSNINIAYDNYESDNGRLVILRGPSYARLENIHNVQVGTLEFHQDSRSELPTIHVDHCVLQALSSGPRGRCVNAATLFNLEASSGRCNFRAFNNIDWYGDPVPDFVGVINAG